MSDEGETPKIACLPNGPYYLLANMAPSAVPGLRRANGEACSTVRGIALCRCGGSRNKPFCRQRSRHTALPARFTNWMPKSAGGEYRELVPFERIR